MVVQLLKEIIDIAKLQPDKGRNERIDQLWLQAEGLLTEARDELDEALPYLRQRRDQPNRAYIAIVKARGILAELDRNT